MNARARGGALVAAFLLSASMAGAGEHPVAVTPFSGPPNAIGAAANGCLSGGAPLALTGSGWQVLRPSRNRYWGHPELISFLADMGQRLAPLGTILIGDMAQPRGGRMTSGHGSHQTGIDVDIMYRMAPAGEGLPDVEQPVLPSMVTESAELDPQRWTWRQTELLKTVASDPRVERIFVNPVVKNVLCHRTGEAPWLAKLRPWWGHDEHFHVRLSCASGDSSCVGGKPLPPGTGCGAEVQSWIESGAWKSRPTPPAHPVSPPEPPDACKAVLGVGG